MPDHDAPEQAMQDELSAYLDGELDAASVRRVEERLAHDADYRDELRRLERAWQMLDRLPRASVDESFTKSTIEMVALSASQEAEAVARELPRRRRRRQLIGIVSMAGALVVGFAVGSQVWSDPNEPLVRDLAVLENLDLYYQADDIKFLRLLEDEGPFRDTDEDAAPRSAASAPAAEEDLAKLRKSIAQLKPHEQRDLLRKYERYSAMPAEEQQHLRDLQAQISNDPNSGRLYQVLARYHEWLKTITPSERAALSEMAPADRVAEIKRIHRRQEDAQRLQPLTREDRREIRNWIDQLVDQHRGELVASISDRYRKAFEEADPLQKRMALVYLIFGRRGRESESRVTQVDIDRLAAVLSPSARGELAKAGTLEAKGKLVRGWILASLRRYESWQGGRRDNPVVAEELLQFLQNDVPQAERERLLKMPREEMLRELRKMYFEQGRGPRRGSEGFRGPGGPRLRESDGRPGPPPRPGSADVPPGKPGSDAPRF
jgi:hypothetical protein